MQWGGITKPDNPPMAAGPDWFMFKTGEIPAKTPENGMKGAIGMSVCVGNNSGLIGPKNGQMNYMLTKVSNQISSTDREKWVVRDGQEGLQFDPPFPTLKPLYDNGVYNQDYTFAFLLPKKGGRRGRGSRRVKRSGSKRSGSKRSRR